MEARQEIHTKQPLMVRTFLKVYMELGSYFVSAKTSKRSSSSAISTKSLSREPTAARSYFRLRGRAERIIWKRGKFIRNEIVKILVDSDGGNSNYFVHWGKWAFLSALTTLLLTGSRTMTASYVPSLVRSKFNVTMEPASPTSRKANSSARLACTVGAQRRNRQRHRFRHPERLAVDASTHTLQPHYDRHLVIPVDTS